jgi:hypothetical protein|tara:strand:- start:3044 stop:3382 length:339 start_codon:yes stop_codon:yes gene_type:complete
MTNWEFFSKRRRTTLEEFVKEAKSYKEAEEIFAKKRVLLPENESLRKLFEKDSGDIESNEKSLSKPLPVKTNPETVEESLPDSTDADSDDIPQSLEKDWGMSPTKKLTDQNQ